MCQDLINGFACSCTPGYVGSICDVRLDRCQSNPCIAGNCTNTLEDGFACACPENRTGIRCEIVSNSCGYFKPSDFSRIILEKGHNSIICLN